MIHGKKGFDRIVYAAKNALNQQLTWLFCNLGISCERKSLLHPVLPQV